nr:hypothetical protein [Pandoravirus aubagnensis]
MACRKKRLSKSHKKKSERRRDSLDAYAAGWAQWRARGEGAERRGALLPAWARRLETTLDRGSTKGQEGLVGPLCDLLFFFPLILFLFFCAQCAGSFGATSGNVARVDQPRPHTGLLCRDCSDAQRQRAALPRSAIAIWGKKD